MNNLPPIVRERIEALFVPLFGIDCLITGVEREETKRTTMLRIQYRDSYYRRTVVRFTDELASDVLDTETFVDAILYDVRMKLNEHYREAI